MSWGNVKYGMNRNYQKMNAGKKYFGILNKKIYRLKILAQSSFSLCLPGSDATVGRLFSPVNALWTEK
jgi:hypothetical protein